VLAVAEAGAPAGPHETEADVRGAQRLPPGAWLLSPAPECITESLDRAHEAWLGGVVPERLADLADQVDEILLHDERIRPELFLQR
jgi:hypothetical protein